MSLVSRIILRTILETQELSKWQQQLPHRLYNPERRASLMESLQLDVVKLQRKQQPATGCKKEQP